MRTSYYFTYHQFLIKYENHAYTLTLSLFLANNMQTPPPEVTIFA